MLQPGILHLLRQSYCTSNWPSVTCCFAVATTWMNNQFQNQMTRVQSERKNFISQNTIKLLLSSQPWCSQMHCHGKQQVWHAREKNIILKFYPTYLVLFNGTRSWTLTFDNGNGSWNKLTHLSAMQCIYRRVFLIKQSYKWPTNWAILSTSTMYYRYKVSNMLYANVGELIVAKVQTDDVCIVCEAGT